MAHILDRNKKYRQAEKEYRSIIAELGEFGGAQTLLYFQMSHCLARNLMWQKRHSEALAELEEALASLRTLGDANGENSARILQTRHERADCLRALGRYEEAEGEIRAVLAIRTKSGDHDDSVVLQERHCLAHALEKLNRCAEAISEISAVADTFERILDADNEKARAARYCLAVMLQSQQKWHEAEVQYQSVLAAESRAIGADHSETLVTRFRLAQVRLESRAASAEETLAIYHDILAKQQTQVGKEHRRTREVRTASRKLSAVIRRRSAVPNRRRQGSATYPDDPN